MISHESSTIGAIDLHCDTLSRLLHAGDTQSLLKNAFHVDLMKLKQGGIGAQIFAVFLQVERTENPLETCLQMIDRFYLELDRCAEQIAYAGCAEDLIRNHLKGKISAMLSIEDSGMIRGDLSVLRMMHKLGVRLVTLTWNYRNQVGSPNTDQAASAEGLTEQGIALLHEMKRLGMIADVSHLSDAGFYDVCRELKGPFVASHSNAREVTSHPRNLTDDMIRTIAELGGVIGINFYSLFLEPYRTEDIFAPYETKGAALEHAVRHIDHIVKVGGIDCIALGSDFDGIDSVPVGLENCTRLPALFEALRKAGYTADDLEKMRYRNAYRVISEVCG